jgi:glycosyltransferase involved in cell wall biosynthesis
MISVIIPAVGDPDLLAITIRSAVANATPSRLRPAGATLEREVIVVGDVEPHAARFATDLPAGRVVWLARPGIRPVTAVNEGLRRARGEFVAILSAGDTYFEETLRIVAETVARYPRTNCLVGEVMLTSADGRPVAEFNLAKRRGRRGRRHCRFCGPAVFFRTATLVRLGGLDEGLDLWAQYELWQRLDRIGERIRHVPRLLAARRCLPAGLVDSDFTRLPDVGSLDELMAVRVQANDGHLSSSLLAWYGSTRAVIERGSSRASGADLAAGRRHAFAAWHRWCDGRPLRPLRRLAVTVKLAKRLLRGSVRKEFTVKPLAPLAVRRLQFLQRKIFRLVHHAPRPLCVPASYARATLPRRPPVISIVTPSFNQGHVLEATLQSVLGQGYPALEYVVQDGGSTDTSVAILERYSPHLLAWESGPDGGQAPAINRGLQRTTGEIMAYLNSDDILLPGALAYVARYFRRHPEVDVVYGHRVLINDTGAEIGRWVLPPHDEQAIAFADFIPQETMFWRRRAWEAVGGGIDESFRFAMDWDLILRFRAAGMTFRRLPRFLGAFRVWQDQKSVSWWLPVGRRETELLTARTLGAAPSRERVRQEVSRYIRRHWILDKLYLAGMVRY